MAAGEIKYEVDAVFVSGDPVMVDWTPASDYNAGDIIVYTDNTTTPGTHSMPMVALSPAVTGVKTSLAVGVMVLDVNNTDDDAILGQAVNLDFNDQDDTVLTQATDDCHLGIALEASGATTTDRVRIVTVPVPSSG